MADIVRRRRSKKLLEIAVHDAIRNEAKALAYYNLGLFHDNNGREAEAIPNYLEAIERGLNTATHAQALAWLASNLYKTGQNEAALKWIAEARALNEHADLDRFLGGLEKRVGKRMTGLIPDFSSFP